MNRGATPLPAFLAGIVDAAGSPDWRNDACQDASWLEVLRRVAEQLSKATRNKSLPWNKLLNVFDILVAGGAPIEDGHLGRYGLCRE